MFALSVLAALGHLSQRERQGTGDTDSHASDIGHWLGMTGQKQGAGAVDDEARTRFPASREWHSHSQEPCLTSKFDALRAGRGSEFKPARGIPKRNTILTDGVSFWSGRRGSNSLPRPWQGRALPDELRPQTQGGLYRIFCGLSTLHFRFARKNQNQGPKALSTPSISPPRRCFQCWDRSSPSSPSCPVRPAPAPRSAAPAVPGYRWS